METYVNTKGHTVFKQLVQDNHWSALAFLGLIEHFGVRYKGSNVEFKLRMKVGSKNAEKMMKLIVGHPMVKHHITKKGNILIGGTVEQRSTLGQELMKKLKS